MYSCRAFCTDPRCLYGPKAFFRKLLNNFKTLANAFSICQGNDRLEMMMEPPLSSRGTWVGAAFLTFGMPSLQYAPVWRVGNVEEKFPVSRA
jgi:hypothetical protein